MVKSAKLPELQFANSAALMVQMRHRKKSVAESGDKRDINSSKVIINELRDMLNLSY